MSTWNCSACTFINKADAIQCEMCASAKPSLGGAVKDVLSPSKVSGWQCVSCTFQNEDAPTTCSMCGSGRPVTKPSAAPPVSATTLVPELKNEPVPIEWICMACTTVNLPSRARCNVCETPNPARTDRNGKPPVRDEDKEWVEAARGTLLSQDARLIQKTEKPQVEEAVSWVPRGSDNSRIRRLIESYIPRVQMITLISEQGVRIPVRRSYAEVSDRVKSSIAGRWYEEMEIRVAVPSHALRYIVAYMNHYRGVLPPVPESPYAKRDPAPILQTTATSVYRFKTISSPSSSTPSSSSSLQVTPSFKPAYPAVAPTVPVAVKADEEMSPLFAAYSSASNAAPAPSAPTLSSLLASSPSTGLSTSLSATPASSLSASPMSVSEPGLVSGKRKSAAGSEVDVAMKDEPNKKEKLSPDGDKDTEMSAATAALSVEDRVTDDFAMALVAALNRKEQADITLSAAHMNIPHLEYICKLVTSTMN